MICYANYHIVLQDKISFMDISYHIEKTLNEFPHHTSPTLSDIIQIDEEIKEELHVSYA